MKHIIIGTAGHIDHGKTTLIKALTGRETDTTKEEKDRGISINLGFTFFDLPSGKRAGIIDVPGHEKFIKNMLAGVSGVDLVILVIAADEGIMPQTKEHFEILQLLNVKKGIIALTKADLVDEEWLSMIKDEVEDNFKGTFLDGAPIIPVSSKTKMGIESLIEEIEKATEEVEPKDTEGHFRLPVDRVFSVSGFGTVVTGTIIGGKVKEGDTVQIYPSMAIGKIRSIQVHEENVKIGEAGQRCALNITNVKVEDIGRGDVVSIPNIMEPSMVIDCKLYHLKNSQKPIENRQRLRLYHGTNEILCRVIILDKEEIKPGEQAYVQLRLERPITVQRNDRYVLRTYSPMVTIAGGSIIEPVATKAKRFKEDYIKELKIKESGDPKDIVESTVLAISSKYPTEFDILKALGKNHEDIKDILKELVDKNKIISLNSSDKHVYIHKNYYENKLKELMDLLEKYHNQNPLKFGMSKEEIKSKIFGREIKQKTYDEILEIMQSHGSIKVNDSFVALESFNMEYTKEQKEMKDRIIKTFKSSGYNSPKYADMEAKEKDKKTFKMVYESLIDTGSLVKVMEDVVYLKEDYLKAKDIIKSYIEENESIGAAEARTVLDTSRKYAVAILEHFDSIKFTKRIEDKRILY
ncbi:selenocysteine-specific translation elongation factor [Clostridium algidicarnis]|uniref:selenocysteine-specific translation elongation factor n=1 Tax=Clostridium algidicarnis TaxID=37659 RepID=UPI001C0E8C97|nr:selenocysteine-specific translation elongation factor [Clostridium algidicarnis]MBU3207804.1 selenocysteine-specific translation elongation factor [Clostridium algidicarnis]